MSVVTRTSPRSRCFPEAVLLGSALFSGPSTYCLVHLGVGESGLPPPFPQIFFVTVLTTAGVHITVRRLAPCADPVFFPAALALNRLGLAMIYRVDIAEEADHASNQLLLSFVAIALMVGTIAVLRNHRISCRFTWTSLVAGIVLLLLPMVLGFGRTINSVRTWINIGMPFQPTELAKICFAVSFVGYLVTERDNLLLAGPKFSDIRWSKVRHFIPTPVAWAACMTVLVMEKDFGTAILFFGLFVDMLYVATERVSWIAIGGLLAALGVAVIVSQVSRVRVRFTVWLRALDPDVYDFAHGSFQLVQGLFDMASGGSFGIGPGQGYPNKVYAASSDFTIVSFVEETGLIGLPTLLYIYLIIVVHGLRMAVVLRDGFGKLLVMGIAFTMTIQCFVVVGGVIRLILLTGLAMSLLAYGGSALMTSWIIIGLLLRIFDSARRPVTVDPLPSDDFLKTISELEKDSFSNKNGALGTQMVKL